jgi:uncharacterized membrane protein YczE
VKYLRFSELWAVKRARVKRLGLLLIFAGLAIPLLTGLLSGCFDVLPVSLSEELASLAVGVPAAVIGLVLVFNPDMPERLRGKMGKWLEGGVYDDVRRKELWLASDVFETLMRRRMRGE